MTISAVPSIAAHGDTAGQRLLTKGFDELRVAAVWPDGPGAHSSPDAAGLSRTAPSPNMRGLTFADLFDIHFAWLTEPAIADWETRLPSSGQSGRQRPLLERLQALAASRQDRDVSDCALLEAWPVHPAAGLAA